MTRQRPARGAPAQSGDGVSASGKGRLQVPVVGWQMLRHYSQVLASEQSDAGSPRRGSAWKANARHTAVRGWEAAQGRPGGSEQYVVLQRPGYPVDDQPPVIAQGGKEPGVG